MNWEKQYMEYVGGFTPWFVARADTSITYLALGDSAGEMVRWMNVVAQRLDIALPTIQVLTHDEVGAMYYRNIDVEKSKQLINPAITADKQVHMLEDFVWDGYKLLDIRANIRNSVNVSPIFYVMVWSGRINVPATGYINVYTKDEVVAKELFSKWNRRVKTDLTNRRSGLR